MGWDGKVFQGACFTCLAYKKAYSTLYFCLPTCCSDLGFGWREVNEVR